MAQISDSLATQSRRANTRLSMQRYEEIPSALLGPSTASKLSRQRISGGTRNDMLFRRPQTDLKSYTCNAKQRSGHHSLIITQDDTLDATSLHHQTKPKDSPDQSTQPIDKDLSAAGSQHLN